LTPCCACPASRNQEALSVASRRGCRISRGRWRQPQRRSRMRRRPTRPHAESMWAAPPWLDKSTTNGRRRGLTRQPKANRAAACRRRCTPTTAPRPRRGTTFVSSVGLKQSCETGTAAAEWAAAAVPVRCSVRPRREGRVSGRESGSEPVASRALCEWRPARRARPMLRSDVAGLVVVVLGARVLGDRLPGRMMTV
jgi:hypothetical protein